MYVDTAVVHVTGGDGGHGCASMRREKFVPFGGPDGGDGGHGGDVIVVAEPGMTHLLEYQRRPHRQAGSGGPGRGGHRHGARGADLLLPVPEGTVVRDADGEVIADLLGPGARAVVAAGGRGGRGNAALISPRRRAPGFALRGEPGEQRTLRLEVKSIADVALVGFPNVGKSSLIAAMSAARPVIADYPFTTLTPTLGVVEADETTFTLADVPGLIPGAHLGRGLGLEFLRHIERCAVIAHVLDPADPLPGRTPMADLDLIEAELTAYGGLDDRPRVVILTKMDLPDARVVADLVESALLGRGLVGYRVSAVTHDGLPALARGLAHLVREARASRSPGPMRVAVPVHQPAGPSFTLIPTAAGFRVTGPLIQRWVHQTDPDNTEAVGYLIDRLTRVGVDESLRAAGATPGAAVEIGHGPAALTFDWSDLPARSAGRSRPVRSSPPGGVPPREQLSGEALSTAVSDDD